MRALLSTASFVGLLLATACGGRRLVAESTSNSTTCNRILRADSGDTKTIVYCLLAWPPLDYDDGTWHRAAQRLRLDEAGPVIVSVIADRREPFRTRSMAMVLVTVLRFRPASSSLVDVLRDDPDPLARSTAARTLGELGALDHYSRAALRHGLHDRDCHVREVCTEILASLSEPHLPKPGPLCISPTRIPLSPTPLAPPPPRAGPIGDRDRDGIADDRDPCPDAPEDRDRFEDDDGCPDPDNDKDQIPDVRDTCPNEPETYNGVQDDDGCPDVGSVALQPHPPIPNHITFAIGSATIPAGAARWLRETEAMLNAHPAVVLVEVAGSCAASEPNPMDLSRKRAQAVVGALVARGIAKTRLRATAHGTECPTPATSKAAVQLMVVETTNGLTGRNACAAP